MMNGAIGVKKINHARSLSIMMDSGSRVSGRNAVTANSIEPSRLMSTVIDPTPSWMKASRGNRRSMRSMCMVITPTRGIARHTPMVPRAKPIIRRVVSLV